MQFKTIIITLVSLAYVSAVSRSKAKPHHHLHEENSTALNRTNATTATATRGNGVINSVNLAGAAAAIAAGAMLL
ncbi:uncharacterized protein LODBEIA_P45860 [Lodderomyces beijingensis]|uniref:Uncharacterized protein n=1 Tax=Lodderomyces beijingensis TaxID=1775926 RepID=A0ABP0ZQG4_9ASCO